ncbi:S-layer homology domain-containing protein [Acetivibrio sp. MSJd-27]|uniref:S-layer homology domain-containing protein n=1 Tax=Acetivibrio sp. MSJd-27 TaxID=2841523 RepID=UPI001C11E5A7|nr:S-layer homology domain-containing protein [Acetivibrio sp. MSJd-27]MBU5451284.1 S-layer homology domain-containing protein [Acetivibrio sp. MSJd-27]
MKRNVLFTSRLLTFAMLVNLFSAAMFWNVSAAELVNLAAEKSVTVSKETSGKNHGRVTDGKKDISTTASAWNVHPGEYIVIDLQESVDFNQVVVYEYSAMRSKGYKLEVSKDNQSWTTVSESDDLVTNTDTGVVTNTPHYKGVINFNMINARYVKLTIKELAEKNTAYIEEIEVYNDPNAKAPEPGEQINPGGSDGDKPSGTGYSDIKESIDAVNTLTGLGIMRGYGDGTFQPENLMTRGEFAAVIARTMNMEEVFSANSNKNIFSDVPAANQFAGYINTLYDMGLISGTSPTEYKPDDPILYEQAVKIIVNLVGYTPLAEGKGGYPYGYILTAEELGITNSLKERNVGENAKRITITQILYNALEIDMMVATSAGDTPSYEIQKGKTILTYYFKAAKKRGILLSTCDSISHNSSMLLEDEVKIDDVTYKIGGTNAKDYLGYCVSFVYREDAVMGEYILISISEAPQRNRTLRIDSDDIEQVSVDSVAYQKDEYSNTQYAKISSSATVYYNGKALSSYGADILKPDSGSLFLIDNNADGSYEAVFVKEYMNIVVDRVIPEENRIVSKYSSGLNLVLDPLDSDYTFYLRKDGKTIALSELKEWNVISVTADKMLDSGKGKICDTENATLYYLDVSDQSVSGTIEQEIAGEQKAVINGKVYQYAKNIQYDSTKLPRLGDSGTFYLDVYGRIAASGERASEEVSMGYLYGINNDSSSLETDIQFKVYTMDDKHEIYSLTDKIRINDGASKPVSMELLQSCGIVSMDSNSGWTLNKELIAFKCNADGKISALYPPVSPEENPDRKAVLEKSVPLASSTRYYRSYLKKFMAVTTDVYCEEFSTDTKAKVIVVPGKNSDADDPMNYEIKSMSYFVNGTKYAVEGYNMSEIGTVPIILCYRNAETVDGKDYLILVSRIITTVNEEGDLVKKIEGIYNGKEVSYLTNSDPKILAEFEESNPKCVKAGDLLEVDLNRKSEICILKKRFDHTLETDKTKSQISNPDKSSEYVQLTYGELVDKDGDYIKLRFTNPYRKDADGNPLVEVRTFYVGGSKVYRYKTANKKAEIVSLDSLVPGAQNSWVLLRFYNRRPREIVIYEN